MTRNELIEWFEEEGGLRAKPIVAFLKLLNQINRAAGRADE